MRTRRLLLVFAHALSVASVACGGSEEPAGGGPADASTSDGSTADAQDPNTPRDSGCNAPPYAVTLPREVVQAAYDKAGSWTPPADAGDAATRPLPDAGPNAFLGPAPCTELCTDGGPAMNCTIASETADSVTLTCELDCTGRRPEGYRPRRGHRARSPLGAYFAAMAELEAASIDAFRALRRELALLGAPKRLLDACSRAGRDERRHTRATSALARRFGGRPERPNVARRAPRSLEALAIDNASEGCVRETFGALLAHAQARAAADPEVRAAMARIARDETEHAALAWAIDAWATARLTPEARRRVQEARARTAAELLASHEAPDASWAAAVGLPSRAQLDAMARELGARLWG